MGLTDLGRLLLPCLLFLTGCMATLPERVPELAGSYRVATRFTHLGVQRSFLLHLPEQYRPGMPLVVVLHGAFSGARQTEQETGFSKLADREGFLVAYPEGAGLAGLLQHWNAGFCCGSAQRNQLDDVGFVAEVIRTVRTRFSADPSRVYLVGMSNGGMLAYRYAVERPAELAAVAVVSGAIARSADTVGISFRLQEPAEALPVMIVHGLDDDVIPVSEDMVSDSQARREFAPASAAVDFWLRVQGGTAQPLRTEARNGSVTKTVWLNSHNQMGVAYVQLAGWGHRWPGPWFTDRLEAGHPLYGFDGTSEIWNFLSGYARSGR